MEMNMSRIWQNLIPHKMDAQGGGMGQNVNNTERMISGVVGAMLLRRAMRGGLFSKLFLGIPAAAALKRAVTGKCELYGAAGLSSMPSATNSRQEHQGIEHHEGGERSAMSESMAPLGRTGT